MIERKSDGIYERESMIVSEGFVVADSYERFGLKNSPFEEYLDVPTFFVFKINEGHPLVLLNTGESMRVYPKSDFDAIQEKKHYRFPAQMVEDKIAHDLAAFILAPYNAPYSRDKNEKGFKKISDIAGEQDSFLENSLLYIEHGIRIESTTQMVFPVMPSGVMNYFYNWVRREHEISHYDDKLHKFASDGKIKIPADNARSLTSKVNALLEERFGVPLLLKGH
ncbi:hypothetical protein HY449_01905 [Candidatus Pacearchaeota archaeon]|nr:hypothetical protein [Candidatus Pacearchaeota archaeon]